MVDLVVAVERLISHPMWLINCRFACHRNLNALWTHHTWLRHEWTIRRLSCRPNQIDQAISTICSLRLFLASFELVVSPDVVIEITCFYIPLLQLALCLTLLRGVTWMEAHRVLNVVLVVYYYVLLHRTPEIWTDLVLDKSTILAIISTQVDLSRCHVLRRAQIFLFLPFTSHHQYALSLLLNWVLIKADWGCGYTW